MKDLIVIIGTILLGCMIFSMMVGDEPTSLKSTSVHIMNESLEAYGQ